MTPGRGATSRKRDLETLLWFNQIGLRDIPRVGGKNASLGEMICSLGGAGVKVPEGFALTTNAFEEFVDRAGLGKKIERELGGLDPDDHKDVARRAARIRRMFLNADFSPEVEGRLREGYAELGRRLGISNPRVAVRSSASTEDLNWGRKPTTRSTNSSISRSTTRRARPLHCKVSWPGCARRKAKCGATWKWRATRCA